MVLRVRIYFFVIVIGLLFTKVATAGYFSLPNLAPIAKDSVAMVSDSIKIGSDTLSMKTDSTQIDSLKNEAPKEQFKSKVEYWARDSMPLSADNKSIHLYGEAKVKYVAEDIELTAAYIELDLTNNNVYASGMPDSTGEIIGNPVFKKGTDEYVSKYLAYNFKTRKAFIKEVVTKQTDGVLHSEKTRRNADGSINIKNGMYTACDAPHPHYGIALTKGKVYPNDKIVFGPAYFVLEDVPLPLGIPFGFFPNKRESTSGVIIPTYGQEASRGFYLRRGGYYFAMSDYYDLMLTGDIFSKGTWGLGAASNYKKIYKYRGNLNVNYYVNKTGITGIDSGPNVVSKLRDFSIVWSHSQEPQANPTGNFSASVNFSTSSYDRNQNYTDPRALMTSQKQSSISYSKTFPNFNFSSNLGATQNATNKTIAMTLPSINFNANPYYPFRSKEFSGTKKWYEDFTIRYSSQLENRVDGKEEDVYSGKAFSRSNNGYRHSVPLSINYKFWQYFNFTPSINYNGMFYTTNIKKNLDTIVDAYGNRIIGVKVDTIHEITQAHGIAPTASLSFSPQFYGMAQFSKNAKIQAIRHVMTPNIGYNVTPQIKSFLHDYKRSYIDDKGKKVEYSMYEGSLYGAPASMANRSMGINFGVGNNVEMKVRSDKDTITGIKKIVLIQSLSFSSSYDPYAAHNNQLKNISMSGTTPIKGISLSYNAQFNPYVMNDTSGVNSTTLYWKKYPKIARFTSGGLSFGYQWSAKKTNNDNSTEKTTKEPNTQKRDKTAEEYNYFDIPLTFSFSYNLSFSKNFSYDPTIRTKKKTETLTQSLTFNGTVPLTPKWMITYNSGYDFKMKDFTMTSFTIHRDLHCWEMNVSFSPFGAYKYYEFKINAKAAMLQDLKYEMRKSAYDYMY